MEIDIMELLKKHGKLNVVLREPTNDVLYTFKNVYKDDPLCLTLKSSDGVCFGSQRINRMIKERKLIVLIKNEMVEVTSTPKVFHGVKWTRPSVELKINHIEETI